MGLTWKQLKSLVVLVRPLLGSLLLTILFGVLGYFAISGIALFASVALGTALDVVSGVSWRTLLSGMIVFGVLRGLFRLTEQYLTHELAFKLLAMIRDVVFEKVRSLSVLSQRKMRSAEMLTMVTKDVELLEVFYAHTIAPVIIGALSALGYIIFFSMIHWSYALLAFLIYVVLSIVIPFTLQREGDEAAGGYRESYRRLSDMYGDRLKGLREILV
ncbi:MAG: ABC transporter transmembrane domain-containing protein, partial [Bacilli bacterium]